MTLTPFSYHRFGAFDTGSGLGGDRVEEISAPGDYLVFEEHLGASEPSLPPPVTIGVTSKQGDVIPVETLVGPYGQGTPFAYRTPWHEGRAIARFSVSEPGLYHIRAVPVSRRQSAGYGPRSTSTKLAVGREVSATWLGGWMGALAFIGAPLMIGLTLLMVAHRQKGKRRGSSSVGAGSGSGSLAAHG